ncbi:saccharopine dehydrogenase C-terminal domain-containing protein [Martelella sp. HB161492]|uniref:saccharopine dehydrogenase family protein n=1 Tax=Martelella sp. HB161492 TaxID=2720726 RepID=UPI00158FD70A|nr:saccharopine dehydrogenase C-terminal domain-containing protein [Martelella sp. HB161492]
MTRFKVAIFGAGNIGSALAANLSHGQDVDVTMIEPSEDALDSFSALGLEAETVRPKRSGDIPAAARTADLIVAATPGWAVSGIAEIAVGAKTHFLDFAPLRAEVKNVLGPLAQKRVVLNGCGIAPGLVENIACNLIAECRRVSELTIRVGSLPRFPVNRLGYGQIWDIDALIDEYTKPCEAIRDGNTVMISPLEELEQLRFNGTDYECFTTSRGLSDLSPYRAAGIDRLTFKTLRYPGHLDHMRFLLDDLGLREKRDMLRSLLMNGLPIVKDDELVLFLTAWQKAGARRIEQSQTYRFRPGPDHPFNAMISAASAYAASLIALVKDGQLGQVGFVDHHQIESLTLLKGPFLSRLIAA